jgi:formylglycine-generating enzyme required for sulfatase activity
MKLRKCLLSFVITALFCQCCYSQWLEISNVKFRQEPTELAGPKIIIDYDINEPNISPESPAYVFVRYSKDSGKSWQLVPMDSLRGNGFDIVEKSGHKQIVWWGTQQTTFADANKVKVRIRGIAMARIPAGKFIMKSLPGGGRDESKEITPDPNIPLYYMAINETTISMYTDYLNELDDKAAGWNDRMTSEKRCGIVRNDARPELAERDGSYSVKPGRENYPVTYVSWYDVVNFLQWCGLRLPTEAEWEKALRGGMYLDGDATKKKPNPMPERRYPWGDESPDADGVFRCNFDSEEDGFAYSAPVGSFKKFSSPYGINDLAGNVAEWTLDWYTTSFHAGLDGFRMVRGGSWMAVPAACDAITGATQLPLKESSIMGFRAAKGTGT